MINKLLIFTPQNTKHYIFVRKVFYLYSLIIKPFYNLGPEILSVMTTNKKVLQGFVHFTTKRTRRRWNNTNFKSEEWSSLDIYGAYAMEFADSFSQSAATGKTSMNSRSEFWVGIFELHVQSWGENNIMTWTKSHYSWLNVFLTSVWPSWAQASCASLIVYKGQEIINWKWWKYYYLLNANERTGGSFRAGHWANWLAVNET